MKVFRIICVSPFLSLLQTITYTHFFFPYQARSKPYNILATIAPRSFDAESNFRFEIFNLSPETLLKLNIKHQWMFLLS